MNDGGPAFPIPKYVTSGEPNGFNEGMTLRDYFAAKAAQGMLANNSLLVASIQSWTARSEDDALDSVVARVAYSIADAMLKERAK